jgi:NCS1 nucleoside transporter family
MGTGDVEKTGASPQITTTVSNTGNAISPPEAVRTNFLSKILPEELLEHRGVQRVLPEERQPATIVSYIQSLALWESVNIAAVNITLGMLAPVLFGLSFKDASLCAVAASILGSAAVAYIVLWGPRSGCRTLVWARFTMGWWPVRILVVLNLIIGIGYSLINFVVAGQILSAVSPGGSMSLVVGIVIVAVITWSITTFGIRLFHYYERYAFLPQLIAVLILYGIAGKNFDLTTPSVGDPTTVIGNRITWFSICLAAAISYCGIAADYFVYYPPQTSGTALFTLSFLGLVTSFTLALMAGIGLASGINSVPAYAEAYGVSQGALLVTAFDSLGGFGKFLSVIVGLGCIANTIPPIYSAGIDFQLLGSLTQKLPRYFWNTVGVIIALVCALAGRTSLSEIFTNFLALMGYWVAIWLAITFEEHLFFRGRKYGDGETRGWDWTACDTPSKLPIGLAALVAFLVGWAGAIICMAQYWYIGPLAKLVGEFGADVSSNTSFAVCFILTI